MANRILTGNMTMSLIEAAITPAAENAIGRRLRNARDLGFVVLAWGGSWSIVVVGFYGVFGIF